MKNRLPVLTEKDILQGWIVGPEPGAGNGPGIGAVGESGKWGPQRSEGRYGKNHDYWNRDWYGANGGKWLGRPRTEWGADNNNDYYGRNSPSESESWSRDDWRKLTEENLAFGKRTDPQMANEDMRDKPQKAQKTPPVRAPKSDRKKRIAPKGRRSGGEPAKKGPPPPQPAR